MPVTENPFFVGGRNPKNPFGSKEKDFYEFYAERRRELRVDGQYVFPAKEEDRPVGISIWSKPKSDLKDPFILPEGSEIPDCIIFLNDKIPNANHWIFFPYSTIDNPLLKSEFFQAVVNLPFQKFEPTTDPDVFKTSMKTLIGKAVAELIDDLRSDRGRRPDYFDESNDFALLSETADALDQGSISLKDLRGVGRRLVRNALLASESISEARREGRSPEAKDDLGADLGEIETLIAKGD